MLNYNFIYELKLLLRSRWIQVLSLLLLMLFGFSALNGKQKVEKRNGVIAAAKLEVEENDEKMFKLLDSVEQGLEVSATRWTIPTGPVAVGNYYPRVAAMEPQSLSFIATGQADLYTHIVKPKVTGDDFALNFTEMTSPIQLLFGSFDLAFVIIYLLPLLIIAFSYNVLSSEKESGSLRLLAAQPIKIQEWVLQKLGLRFFWLSILVIGCMIVAFLLLRIDFLSQPNTFFMLLGLTLTYMLFWFALAFIVNIWVGSSARNAVSMLGLWVIFVLLIPSMLNQLGNSLYPMPSRTLMINEMRVKKTEVATRQDEILDNYLRDHPEYAINDTTQSRGFYHRYMASQQIVKEELEPIINSYELQLKNQQELIGNLKWISPALSAQEALNKLAGTSTSDYEDFRKQVVAFAESWRGHLIPFLYNNQEFSTSDVKDLPQFQFKPQPMTLRANLMPLLLTSIGLLALGIIVSWGRRKRSTLIEA